MTARPAAAALLMAQFAAMWGAFFILAPAIDWPASLDLPPADILPLIRAQAGAVFAGYLSDLTHALLLIPLALLAGPALRMPPGLAAGVVVLGALAALAKALDIVRWLFLMPGPAGAWADPATPDATRVAIAVVYHSFNAYAGGIGEILGVGLFTGTFSVLLSVALLRNGARWLGHAGMAASALLFSTVLSVVGIESPVMLTLSGILWQVWTAAVAVHLWRNR
jgi:hypothetical protein